MSDNFERLVDVDVAAQSADGLAQRVIDDFWAKGLITGELNEDCVLGGQGYRPGPAIQDLYLPIESEMPFWKRSTCGVEPEIGRHFNVYALGPEFDGLTCPACRAVVRYSDSFGDGVANAIDEWSNQSGGCLLQCPECAVGRSICDWACKPPLGFGNLSFTFWNWPPFDYPSWKIDIGALVAKITGHRIVRTWGHI